MSRSETTLLDRFLALEAEQRERQGHSGFSLGRFLYEYAHRYGEATGPACWDDEPEQHKHFWRERAESLVDPSGHDQSPAQIPDNRPVSDGSAVPGGAPRSSHEKGEGFTRCPRDP